jgi:uncharacterized protein YllA (UPF0747 family)
MQMKVKRLSIHQPHRVIRTYYRYRDNIIPTLEKKVQSNTKFKERHQQELTKAGKYLAYLRRYYAM